ncbi:MAG: hypothetical protein ACK59X_27350 [Acidovorax sp.]
MDTTNDNAADRQAATSILGMDGPAYPMDETDGGPIAATIDLHRQVLVDGLGGTRAARCPTGVSEFKN